MMGLYSTKKAGKKGKRNKFILSFKMTYKKYWIKVVISGGGYI